MINPSALIFTAISVLEGTLESLLEQYRRHDIEGLVLLKRNFASIVIVISCVIRPFYIH